MDTIDLLCLLLVYIYFGVVTCIEMPPAGPTSFGQCIKRGMLWPYYLIKDWTN